MVDFRPNVTKKHIYRSEYCIRVEVGKFMQPSYKVVTNYTINFCCNSWFN